MDDGFGGHSAVLVVPWRAERGYRLPERERRGAGRRVLAGEREEFAALVERHQETLYRHALGMVATPTRPPTWCRTAW